MQFTFLEAVGRSARVSESASGDRPPPLRAVRSNLGIPPHQGLDGAHARLRWLCASGRWRPTLAARYQMKLAGLRVLLVDEQKRFLQDRSINFTVELKLKGKVNHVLVDAEDALIAALKAKAGHSEASIMYVRPQIVGATLVTLLSCAPRTRVDGQRPARQHIMSFFERLKADAAAEWPSAYTEHSFTKGMAKRLAPRGGLSSLSRAGLLVPD